MNNSFSQKQAVQNFFMRSTNVSEILPIAKSSLFKIVHDSRIGSIMVDSQYYVKISDLLKYIQEHNLDPIQDFLAIDKEALQKITSDCITDADFLAALPANCQTKNVILLWVKRMKPKVILVEEKKCLCKEDVLKIIEKIAHQKEKEYQKFMNGFSVIEQIVSEQQHFLIYQMPSPLLEKDVCVEPNIPKIIEQE